jgi:hypothetical protein
MKLVKVFILFIVLSFNAAAQDFRLGKVSKEELEEKLHPADTSAAAAYLFKRGKTYFDNTDGKWYIITEVESRIKIYKKEGYDYATEEVPFYTGGRTIRLNFTDAYTYNLVGGKIEKTKLKSDGEFEEKINDNYSIKKITMPNVKEGSVIEYKYTISTPYLSDFRDWYFQYPIPANNISYQVAIPTYFTYNRYMSGYIKVKRTEPSSRMGVRDLFPEVSVTYSVENVKALRDEAYVDNIDNYLTILKHELAAVQYPNQPQEKISLDWASVAKTAYEDSDFGKQLDYDNYFKEDLDALITSNHSPMQKVDIIFNYVKNRMNWNKKYGYYCDNGVKKAYETKVGNVGDINLMLTAMLRYARLDANPILVSTRANGVALYPARTAYNYVITGVKVNNEIVLLDATSKNTQPNVLPVRALNWMGRMIVSNGASAEIDLMPKKNSREVINIAATIDGEGKVSGKIREAFYDNYALSFREQYGDVNKDSYIEQKEKKYKGLEINEYNVSNDKDLTKPVIEDFSFSHSGLSDVIGDKIYINPMLFYTMSKNPFTAETREYPIDFTYPHQDKYMITLKIPDGYVVESMPQPGVLSMEQNIGMFKYNIASSGNQIQVVADFDINYPNISAQYYGVLKDFYQKMFDKQNEKIVLAKKK